MKQMAAVFVAAAIAAGSGCGPSTVVLRGASMTAAADLSGCAKRHLARLGYTVRESNPERGVIHAVKNTSSTRMVLFSGKDSEDRLVVTTQPGDPDGRSTMRVAAESLFWGADDRKIPDRPSRLLTRDANQILEACGIFDAVRGH
jgi:hypothetical protein